MKFKFISFILAFFLIILLISIILGCSNNDKSTNPNQNILKITSINPDSAKIDDIIIIYGSGFKSIQDSSYVLFNSIKAVDYISWADTEIKVKVPTGATSGKVSVTADGVKSNEVDFVVISPNPTLIETVLIPAGTFQMGSTGDYSLSNEEPVHTVTISRDFLMSKYEVTQKQYEAVI